MKAIEDLIKEYKLEIRNIRLDIAKLNREAETLQDVVNDLQEIVQENEIRQVTEYNKQLGMRPTRAVDKETISVIETNKKKGLENE